jgi:hypothetical protein
MRLLGPIQKAEILRERTWSEFWASEERDMFEQWWSGQDRKTHPESLKGIGMTAWKAAVESAIQTIFEEA